MRKWIVGLLCALIGPFGAWSGWTEGSIVSGASGIALLAAGIFHIVRNSRKSMGFLELAWGSGILLRNVASGQGISSENSQAVGRSFALLVAVVLVIAGLWHLLRPAKAAEASRS